MQTIKISKDQSELVNIVKLVTTENRVYQLETAEDSVIILPYKEYEILKETIELLSIPGLRESLLTSLQQVSNNETYSLDEVLGDID
jgi:PHD/YefM family antitoxin component YafN of YafNO toxin-antitoxin module